MGRGDWGEACARLRASKKVEEARLNELDTQATAGAVIYLADKIHSQSRKLRSIVASKLRSVAAANTRNEG